MRIALTVLTLVWCAAGLPAAAQQAAIKDTPTLTEPAEISAVHVIRAMAVVSGIEKTTRCVTLRTADGRIFDVVAGHGVRNFDQIQIGDEVMVSYSRAISLNLKKRNGAADRQEVQMAYRAQPGDRPAGLATRQVSIVADVIEVNEENRTITLKGPKGNLVELDVTDPAQFKLIREGDQVEAEYRESLAVAVEPVRRN